jgi:hypothetical protein
MTTSWNFQNNSSYNSVYFQYSLIEGATIKIVLLVCILLGYFILQPIFQDPLNLTRIMEFLKGMAAQFLKIGEVPLVKILF